jgi:hypothetical protein
MPASLSTQASTFIDPAALMAIRTALVALLLAGCVSPAERELRTREAHYKTVLSKLKGGDTRADLCRLLPPVFPAKPHDTDLVIPRRRQPQELALGSLTDPVTLSGLLRSPPPRNFGSEIHWVDRDFFVSITYEYRRYRQLRPLPEWWDTFPFPPNRRTGGLAISQNAIDELLFGGGDHDTLRPHFRVYPNSRDRIVVFIPLTLRRASEWTSAAFYFAYDPDSSHQKVISAIQ